MMPAPVAMLGCWLLGCSIASFVMMGLDKIAARGHRPRTREATLLTLAAVGGWPGTIVAMEVFHHKNQKDSFRLRCALASAFNAILVLLVVSLDGHFR